MSAAEPQDDDRRIGQGVALSAFLIIGLVLGGWWWRNIWLAPSPVEPVGNDPLPTYPSISVPPPAQDLPQLPLVDITAPAGLNFIHENGTTAERRLPESMGGGSVAFDFDLDGDQDLLLIHSAILTADRSSLVLYANQGDATFRDVTLAAGLHASLVGMGATAVDYDEDGWPDLLVTGIDSARLWRNQGGWFGEVTSEVFVDGPPSGWSLAACWLDYDRDGDLDLFVGHYLAWSAERDDALNCRWNGIDPSYCDPDLFAGTQPRLYRNLGDGRLRDVTAPSELEVVNADTGQPVAKITSAVATDLNGDGWADVIANGDGAPNLVFLNQRDGRLREVGREWGLAYDRQGLVVRSFGLEVGRIPGQPSPIFAMGRVANAMNALFVKSPEAELWTDHALTAGCGLPSRLVCTWGLRFVDLDLDGRLDLITANGQHQEGLEALQTSQSRAQAPQIYWSRSQSPPKYELLTSRETGTEALLPLAGRGVNGSDFDGDGDPDLLLTANGGPPRLLRNNQTRGHHFVRIELHGRQSPRDPRGALITFPDLDPTVVAEWQPQGGYLTQHEAAIVIGLGERESIHRIEVHWPSGTRQELEALPVDQRLVVIEPDTGTERDPTRFLSIFSGPNE
ncbi:MAG: CRTAC1 family protein [Planctomycetaceae bacterium]|nr:CRTAC1 family protein [Planctomycetaceae bacterium]